MLNKFVTEQGSAHNPSVGPGLGPSDGIYVGISEGSEVGPLDGVIVGASDGNKVAAIDGVMVGLNEGDFVGRDEGKFDGLDVGVEATESGIHLPKPSWCTIALPQPHTMRHRCPYSLNKKIRECV